MKIIENRRKEPGLTPMGESRKSMSGQGETRQGREIKEKANARSTRGEQSKTPKRRNDALGDLGSCCFMYEK